MKTKPMKTKNAALLIIVVAIIFFLIGRNNPRPTENSDSVVTKTLIDSSGVRPAWVDSISTSWMTEDGECACFKGVSEELTSLDSARLIVIVNLVFDHSRDVLKEAHKMDTSFSWRFRDVKMYWEKYLVETKDGAKRECYTAYFLVSFYIYSSEDLYLDKFYNPRVAICNAGVFRGISRFSFCALGLGPRLR